MLGPDLTVSAVPVAGAAAAPAPRPPPEPRTVESSAEAQLDGQQSAAQPDLTPDSLKRLISSARTFAALLDATGDVRMAASLSGFRAGQLDIYA